jgi:hypothetical protein
VSTNKAAAAAALISAADCIREYEGVYSLVDRYFRDRDVDADAEDIARALLDAASLLMRATA